MDDLNTLFELHNKGLVEILGIKSLPLTEEQKNKSIEERKFIMNFKVQYIIY